MHISSVNDIVQGELLNSPSVSLIYTIKTNPLQIHVGDLFIAKSEIDIKEAIKNGAFAIIFDFNTKIIDDEIAWIRVANRHIAILQLIRFKLSSIELQAYYCNAITFKLLHIFIKQNDPTIKLLSNNPDNLIELFNHTEDNIKTVICPDKKILDTIYPKNSNFNATKYQIKNLITHSLFETTFSYKNNCFSRIKLPSLYINNFLDIYLFLNQELDINRLKKSDSLKPIFIDKYFKSVEYGNSNKFILHQSHTTLATSEINYLKENYNYAKIFIFAKKSFQIEKPIIDYFINTLEEIKEVLNHKRFNALYIAGFSQKEIAQFTTRDRINALL